MVKTILKAAFLGMMIVLLFIAGCASDKSPTRSSSQKSEDHTAHQHSH